MDEIYKDIEGYEGLYQVSNLGNVKSLNYHNTKKEKVLKPSIINGYLHVILFKNKTSKCFLVHRLVAQSFIENHNDYPCVNHKDENKQNNSVENLEWCNHRYNNNYGSANERRAKAIKNNTNRSKAISKAMTNNPKRSKSVGAYKDGKLLMTFPSKREAHRNGFCQACVGACCRNCFNRPGNNVYKGYEWRYL